MSNEVDEIDDYEYNQIDEENENDETFNNQINMALQMSLRDVNNQAKYLNKIFEQYIAADDDLKNIILEDLSQNDLNDLLTMIETQNDISNKLILDNERQMLIQLQDMEYNESLKKDIEKDIQKQQIIEKYDDEKINDIDGDGNGYVDIEEVRKKRLDFYYKK